MPSKRELLLQRCFARCGGGNATSWEYSHIDVIVVDVDWLVAHSVRCLGSYGNYNVLFQELHLVRMWRELHFEDMSGLLHTRRSTKHSWNFNDLFGFMDMSGMVEQ
jgi:hypothetical protein